MAAKASRLSDIFGLKENAAAWLPTHEPETKQQILAYLTDAAASGLDPIAALNQNFHTWFGKSAGAALPAVRHSATGAGPRRLPTERLRDLHQLSLWPYRPKRLLGELFSSWLWRLSVASKVAPVKFIRDLPGLRLTDIDRDISPATIDYLAQRTGQPAKHLAAGTINPAFDAQDDTVFAAFEAMLLQDERFLQLRDGSSYRNKRLNCLSYCPLCLRTDDHPYFRRHWRFNLNIVCTTHRCLLHNACGTCGAPVELMAQIHATRQPECGSCGKKFCDAEITKALNLKRQQERIDVMLLYLGTCIPQSERKIHLDTLLKACRPMPDLTISVRSRNVPKLKPADFLKWFGEPVRPVHIRPLRLLAQGTSYDLVIKALQAKANGTWPRHTAAG
jgi:hypothetical protein